MNWRDEHDHTLMVNWSRDLNQFVNDGVEPLTGAAIDTAIKLARQLRKVDSPKFTMVPDVNGGIVFEYKIEGLTYVFDVDENGGINACTFRGTELIHKYSQEAT